MNELNYKKMRVLGKVVKTISEGEVDLLQGSSLHLLDDKILDPLFGAFKSGQSKLGEETDIGLEQTDTGLQFPEVKRYIKAPVVEIFPIAVYI